MTKSKKNEFIKFNDAFSIQKNSNIKDDMIRILYKITIFGFVPLLIIGSLFYFIDGKIGFGIVEVSFSFLLILVFKLKIPNQGKVIFTILLIYMISFFVLFTTGNSGAGLLSIFGTIIFASIFMEKRIIYLFFSFNIVVFIVVTILFFSNNLDSFLITQYGSSWIIFALVINILAICIIILENYLISHINSNANKALNRMNYLNGILNCSDEGIITVNLNSKITLINNKAKEMLEIENDVVGRDYYEVVNFINKKNNRKKSVQRSYSLDIVDSHVIFFNSNKQRNYTYYKHVGEIRDEMSSLYAYSVMFRDITEQLEKENEIIYISLHDHLTGLFNRRYYESKLKILDTEEYYPLSFIMCDVNGLKLINDSLGHKEGDNLLIEVSKILKETFRKNDVIARIGGDEFMILLPNTSHTEGTTLVNRLKTSSDTRNLHPISISIAIGLGTKTKKAQRTSEVEKNVEDEMYSNKIAEGSSAKSKIVDMIITTLYEKNNRELHHSKRVSRLCELISKAMKKDSRFVNQVKLAGLMHDIGKIGIKEKTLNKNTSLDKEEFEEIKKHPEIGYRILKSVKEFADISTFIHQHHEKLDGSGYPQGISGMDILPQTRIIAVADAYDAMTGYRTYKKPLSKEQAISELIKYSGTQFDPVVVDVFIKEVLNNEK